MDFWSWGEQDWGRTVSCSESSRRSSSLSPPLSSSSLRLSSSWSLRSLCFRGLVMRRYCVER